MNQDLRVRSLVAAPPARPLAARAHALRFTDSPVPSTRPPRPSSALDGDHSLCARSDTLRRLGPLPEITLRFQALISSRGRASDAGRIGRRSGDAGPAVQQAWIARSPRSLLSAGRLVEARYAWRQYRSPVDPIPVVVFPRGRDDETTVVAGHGGVIAGTITVRLHSGASLLSEATHGDTVRAWRSPGRRLCEFTRLAVGEGEEAQTLLAALYAAGYAVAREAGATDILVEVNPRHVAFYRRVLSFETIGEERICARVGAPSMLLRLDCERFDRKLAGVDLSGVPERRADGQRDEQRDGPRPAVLVPARS